MQLRLLQSNQAKSNHNKTCANSRPPMKMVDLAIGSFKLNTEIPVLLLFYSFMLTDPVNTNFIIYRTCYVSLGYNESDCRKLGTENVSNATVDLEMAVEPYANVIMMTSSLVIQILPPLLCLFIGPWSDRNGRKPVLISTLLGFTIGGIVQIVISTIPFLSPWFILTTAIPVVLFGGFPPFIMAVLCHISDLTTPENRGIRVGIFEGVIALGMLGGTLSSAYLFNAIGYIGVYCVSTGCMFIALLYVIFLTSESLVVNQDQEKTGIFSLSHIKAMLRATFKQRVDYQRSVLLLTLVIAVLYLMSSLADASVIFLYLREKFYWSLDQYTLFRSVRSACYIVGTFVGLFLLHKFLGLSEAILIFIGFVSYFASALLQGLAVNNWQLYLAGAIKCISGVISPMVRSLISKVIEPDEIGKVFAMTVTLESLGAIIGSPIYTFIYNKTISTMPAMFNFVTAGLFGIQIILVLVIIVIQRLKGTQYILLEDTSEE